MSETSVERWSEREVEHYLNVIRRAVLSITRDGASVEDIVQETLLHFIQGRGADELYMVNPDARETYIRHAAQRVAKERLKELARRRLELAKRGLKKAKPPESARSAQDAFEEGEWPDTDILSMLRQTEEGPDAVSPPPPVEMLNEVVQDLSKNLKLYEQVCAQLDEVDGIIERLARDREEIDRLKEETRSNISELQRMIAA